MKILFVHEVNYLTKPIYEYQEFPEGLARLGNQVAVVHFAEGAKPSGHGKRAPRTIELKGRVWNDVQLSLYTPRTLSGSFIGRLGFALTSFWQINKILREYRPDVVVCLAVPTNGWQALLAAKKNRTPFVYRALDVSHKIRRGWFTPLVKAAEKFIYRASTSISANNLRMLKYCQEISGEQLDGAAHLPPLNLQTFAGGDRDKGRRRLGLQKEAKVVLYLGSFFHFSGLDRCLIEMARVNDDSILLLIGGGDQMGNLKGLAERMGLSNRVLFTGFLPFQELPDLVSAADVAINPMLKSLVADCALPHKVLQYMACGIPVVSTNLDGLQATLGDDSGVTFRDSPELVMRDAINLASAKSIQSEVARKQLRKLKAIYREDPVKVFESFLLKWSKA